jgi:hypothetical protein
MVIAPQAALARTKAYTSQNLAGRLQNRQRPIGHLQHIAGSELRQNVPHTCLHHQEQLFIAGAFRQRQDSIATKDSLFPVDPAGTAFTRKPFKR